MRHFHGTTVPSQAAEFSPVCRRKNSGAFGLHVVPDRGSKWLQVSLPFHYPSRCLQRLLSFTIQTCFCTLMSPTLFVHSYVCTPNPLTKHPQCLDGCPIGGGLLQFAVPELNKHLVSGYVSRLYLWLANCWRCHRVTRELGSRAIGCAVAKRQKATTGSLLCDIANVAPHLRFASWNAAITKPTVLKCTILKRRNGLAQLRYSWGRLFSAIFNL